MSDYEYVFVLDVKIGRKEKSQDIEEGDFTWSLQERKIVSPDFVITHVEENGEVDYDGCYILQEQERKNDRNYYIIVPEAKLVRKKVWKTSVKQMYLESI